MTQQAEPVTTTLSHLSWSQNKACLQSAAEQPKQWSQTKLFWCLHVMQNRCRDAGNASACYVNDKGAAGEIGEVGWGVYGGDGDGG